MVIQMLEYLESIENISIRELAKGLCSESYLSKVRHGERVLGGIHFIYIIKRLYLSPERFLIKIDKKECRLLLFFDKCQKLIAGKQYQELKVLIESDISDIRIRNVRTIIDKELDFYKYIVLREENNYKDALIFLKKSLDYMINSNGSLNRGRYSTEEINRFMNYIDLSLCLSQMQKEDAKACCEQILTLIRLRNRDPIEEAKLYPRIVCFILRTVGDQYTLEQWKSMIKEALGYLQKTKRCCDLPELLRLFKAADEETTDPDLRKVNHWYYSVCKAYEEGKYCSNFNIYDSHDSSCQLYYIHEYLRQNRLGGSGQEEKPYTQYNISEGIMETKNYQKIESGRYRPNRENYKKLAEKLGVSSELYHGEIVTNHLEDFYLITDIRHSCNTGDIKELRRGLSTLSSHLDRKYPENAQFIDQKKINLDVWEKRYTEKESIDRSIKVLEYTVPYKTTERHIYSTLELETIYKIVRNKRLYGLMTDEDINILQSCLEKEEKIPLVSWRRQRMLRRLLTGIIQVKGDTEKSANMSRECIKMALAEQDGSLLADFLDILAESILEIEPEHAAELLRAAYWLLDLYEDKVNKPILARFYLQLFNKPIDDQSLESVGGTRISSGEE